MAQVNVWVDDLRNPPKGWIWAKNLDEAKKAFSDNEVLNASLDHDYGPCGDKCQCTGGPCDCECHKTNNGSKLVDWMEESGLWPINKPTVHSQNPTGAQYMRAVINKHYDGNFDGSY